MVKEILRFLANHNDGEYRSSDILFADFLRTHLEYIDRQRELSDALNSCFAHGFIKNREYPSYFIYITEDGRRQI